jgi:hypothetical protein
LRRSYSEIGTEALILTQRVARAGPIRRGASLELALNRLAADQYDQIIRTDSNRLQDTTIAGTGSKRWRLRLNIAALPGAICRGVPIERWPWRAYYTCV